MDLEEPDFSYFRKPFAANIHRTSFPRSKRLKDSSVETRLNTKLPLATSPRCSRPRENHVSHVTSLSSKDLLDYLRKIVAVGVQIPRDSELAAT